MIPLPPKPQNGKQSERPDSDSSLLFPIIVVLGTTNGAQRVVYWVVGVPEPIDAWWPTRENTAKFDIPIKDAGCSRVANGSEIGLVVKGEPTGTSSMSSFTVGWNNEAIMKGADTGGLVHWLFRQSSNRVHFKQSADFRDLGERSPVILEPILDVRRARRHAAARLEYVGYHPDRNMRSFDNRWNLFRDVGLSFNRKQSVDRNHNINDRGYYVDDRDIDDCPTGRRWPPPFLVDLIFSADGLLLTYYSAKRLNELGLEGRLYGLWRVPFARVIVIAGCRLRALDRWWF
jgi:hypothetical protein